MLNAGDCAWDSNLKLTSYDHREHDCLLIMRNLSLCSRYLLVWYGSSPANNTRSTSQIRCKYARSKSLILILDNIPVPVSNGSSTYLKVVNAWRNAMTGLEDLLTGKSQQTSDGSVLLAFSAWHLHHVLIVLSSETKHVSLCDNLFPPQGVVTVGLRSPNLMHDEGIQW